MDLIYLQESLFCPFNVEKLQKIKFSALLCNYITYGAIICSQIIRSIRWEHG